MRVVAFQPPSPAATVTLSPTWHYQTVSDAAADMVSMTPAAMIGRCAWDVFPGYDATPLGVVMRAVMATRIEGEVRTMAHVAPDRDVIAVVQPVRDGGIVVTFRLVPGRRPLERMEATA